MQRFTNPRDIFHGKGALEALKTFEGKKAVICVGGGSMKRFGFVHPAAGNEYASVKLTPEELMDASGACGWCDICKGWEETE